MRLLLRATATAPRGPGALAAGPGHASASILACSRARGSAPTTSRYNCRPYLDGASETCELTVPSNQSQAFIGIRGYTAATYNISVTYTPR